MIKLNMQKIFTLLSDHIFSEIHNIKIHPNLWTSIKVTIANVKNVQFKTCNKNVCTKAWFNK